MKKRNKRRFSAWLMAMVLALNVFLPVGNIQAIAETTADESVITVDTEAPKVQSSDEISVATGSNAHKGGTDLADDDNSDVATGSDARKDTGTLSPADPMPSMVSLFLPVTFDAGRNITDDTDLIKNINITIKSSENGSPITQITNGDSFYVSGSFTAVARQDDPEGDWIKDGDYITWNLNDNVKDRPSVDLKNGGGEVIGTLSFDPGGGVAKITFNDTYQEEGATGGKVTFGADLEYWNDNNESIGSEGDTIIIFGQNITLMPKVYPIVPTVTKDGSIEGDKIKWTVTVNATQEGKTPSLKDFVFQDDLATVGDYVADSFDINGITNATPTITGTKISYTFGDVTGPKIITFYTKIPDNKMLGGDITNKANFGVPSDSTKFPSASKKVTVPTVTVITKDGKNSYTDGGTYDPTTEKITWTITVDPKDIPMTGVTVTDPISGIGKNPTDIGTLTFESATWQWADTAQSPFDKTLPLDASTSSNEPAGGVYKLNNTTALAKPVKLVIVTKVPHGAYAPSTGSYSNTAKLTWDGFTTGTTASANGIGVGINSLEKSVGTIDYSTHQIPWTITFDKKGQTNFPTNLKVYDLLIYGSSDPGSITAGSVDSTLLSNLQKQYDQKFASADGFVLDTDYSIVPVMSGTTRVGDLLIVNITDGLDTRTFSFKTQVLNPNIFAKNGSTTVKNKAFLYTNTTFLDDGYRDTSYNSSVLSKSVQGNFDYATKTAVFRLDINKDGIDLTGSHIDGGGTTLGKITVVDTLPQGWRFVDYSDPNVKFELHKANGDLVSDTDRNDIFDAAPIFTDSTSTSVRNTATFVFKKLDAQYYILVKATLPEERYQELLGTAYGSPTPALSVNQTNEINMTSQSAPGWSPNGSAGVTVNTDVLKKSGPDKVIEDGKWTGELNWKIQYNPYDFDFLNKDNIRIVDTLAPGLSMVYSQQSGLDYSTVKVTEWNGPASTFPGSGGTVLSVDTLKDKLKYDGINKLTFTPTPGKLYQLEYTTYVTDANLASVSNSVLLEASSTLGVETGKSYSVANQWGSAEMKFVGLVKITKEGNSGQKLQGAEFTLYDKDKNSMGITATSNSSGLAQFAIPSPLTVSDGTYTFYLKETKAPAGGYVIDPTWHEVNVKMYQKTATKVRPYTTIDDPEFHNSPESSNQLTVKNYLATDIGSLTVRKTVDGNAGDTDKEFTFHVTVNGAGSRNYPSDNGNILFTNNTADVSLKDGESITISNLPSNASYSVTEDSASLDHHVPSYTGQTGNISATETKIAAVTNTRNEVSISKRDASNGNELPGATLQLWNGLTKVDEWISGTTPHIMYNLSDGNYRLVEITAPNGYLTAEEIQFTVTGGKTTPVVMFDTHKDEIVISKQDITNGEELPGATLQLWKDGVKTDEWISGKQPHIINYLEDGNYELVEITAPKGYFTAEKVTFTVTNGKPDKQVIMYDKPIEIPVSKQDITNGNELPGATLQLWKDGQKVEEWISGSKPHVVKYLEDGNYELVEITAPNGYLTAEKVTFTVKDGTTEQPVVMLDKPVEISISKQDITNGKELPGAILQLWKDGVKTDEWVSGDTPHIVKYLEDGTYQLVEITAPNGYLTAEKITFTVKNGTTDSPVIMMDRPYIPSSGGGGGNGGGPVVHPTQPAPTAPTEPTTPAPIQKPREEMTPQEIYNVYGEVPRGYMVGPDNSIHTPQEIYDIWGQVPLGYMVGIDGQLVPLGLPKTGDGIPANMAMLVMFGLSVLLGIFAFATTLRKEEETDN